MHMSAASGIRLGMTTHKVNMNSCLQNYQLSCFYFCWLSYFILRDKSEHLWMLFRHHAVVGRISAILLRLHYFTVSLHYWSYSAHQEGCFPYIILSTAITFPFQTYSKPILRRGYNRVCYHVTTYNEAQLQKVVWGHVTPFIAHLCRCSNPGTAWYLPVFDVRTEQSYTH